MKKSYLFYAAAGAVCLIFSISCSGCVSSSASQKAPDGYHLVWSDEFNGNSVDESKWDFQYGTGSQYGLDGWGNQEIQYYTKENAYVKNGCLVLEGRKEEKEGMHYTSARLRTIKDDGTVLFAKTYGRIEARIKLPAGNGFWPAFWMLPATDDYGTWAASGELDIMEARGRLKNRVYGTVHYGQAWPRQKNSGGMYKLPAEEDFTGFHVYALEWEPGLLRWLVDGNVYYETSQWWSMGQDASEPYPYPAPYDKPFYIILNLALGGTFDNFVSPEEYLLPAQMYVDYVRVYDKDEPYNENVKRPVPERDEKLFNTFKTDGDNFIFDSSMLNVTPQAMSTNEMDIHERAWYFLALSEYEGQAVCSYENGMRRVKINAPGKESYSVQLIQHLPVAKGYSYRIEFDAKASSPRSIALKVGGDTDNNWAVYSPEYNLSLTTEIQHFSYLFTMENPTDVTARLEFNMGLDTPDVYISNVSVTQVDF